MYGTEASLHSRSCPPTTRDRSAFQHICAIGVVTRPIAVDTADLEPMQDMAHFCTVLTRRFYTYQSFSASALAASSGV